MHKFIGIGVGPGDPELLTVKAVKTLESLDILLVPTGRKEGPSEAHLIVQSYLKPHTEIIKRHFPMSKDMDTALDAIAEEIKDLIQSGKTVGFVTLGDPMLYSTYIYLLRRLKDDIEIETVAGISSYTAIASGFNHPLVEGDMPLLVYPCIDDLSDLESKLSQNEAIVLMKAYKSFEHIKSLVEKLEIAHHCLVVSDFGKPHQKVYKDILAVSSEDISYFTTILINKRWSL